MVVVVGAGSNLDSVGGYWCSVLAGIPDLSCRQHAKGDGGGSGKMTYASIPINEILDGARSWDDEEVVQDVEHILHNTEWFEDIDGNLYIIDKEDQDVYASPDNEIASDLVAGVFWAQVLEASMYTLADAVCGSSYIPDSLRRFSPEDGFYHV